VRNPMQWATSIAIAGFDRLGHRFNLPPFDSPPPSWRLSGALTSRERLLAWESTAAVWRVVGTLLVMVVGIIHYRMLFDWSGRTPYDFDAIHTYLPMAKQLLADGPKFFLTERGISVPPFSVVFPALFGAEIGIQRQVNMGLSVLIIGLMFRTGYLLHSITAGVLMAAAYGLSPHFWPYMSTASVEAIYMFLLVATFWSFAEGWRGARWGYVVGGVLLGLATLTRATVLYFLPLVIVGAWWRSRRSEQQQSFWRGLRNAHAIALAIVAPLIAKNMLLWGVSAVSTGAGIALLSGHHPLTYGFESNYFNLNSDHGLAASEGMTHLDVRANASFAAMANFIIADLPAKVLLKMYALKTSAILFATNREWLMPVTELRGWRVALLGAATLSLFAVRRVPLLGYVWLFFAFQVALHLPVLYAHRYSVSAVDLPLAVLAGTGVAFALFNMRWWVTPLAAASVCVAWWVGTQTTFNLHFHAPNLYGVSHRVVLGYDRNKLPISNMQGFVLHADGKLTQTEETGTIEFDFSALPAPRVPQLALSMLARIVDPANPGQCIRVRLDYRAAGEESFTRERTWSQPWTSGPETKKIIYGGAAHIRLNEPGRLRMHFTCRGATLDIERLELVQTRTMVEYRKQFFEKHGVGSWEEWYRKYGYTRGR
jgi:hypothetical protein